MSTCPATCLYSTTRDPPSQPPKSGYGFYRHALDELESLPAVQKTLESVGEARRNGRPGYPPRVMLRAFCLRFLLTERFTVGFVERLKGSPRLREICELGDRVPSNATFSRFFARMLNSGFDVERAIAQVVERIRGRRPGTARVVAVDSTDLEAWANPNRAEVADPNAAWGYRTAKNKSGGKGAGKKKETELFFGYKMHSLVDVEDGTPLVHIFLPANVNDSQILPLLVEKAEQTYEWFSPEYLLGDRGYDSQANHKFLYNRGIAPIIPPRKPTAHDGLYDGIYHKSGSPVCDDGKTPMEYVGTDPETGRHEFRCPPDGCAMKAKSNGSMRFCDAAALRIHPEESLRALGVVARAGPQWRELYRGRQVIERGFGSLKRSRLLNKHQYIRSDKIEFHVGMSILTYAITLLTHIQAGDPEKMRHMRIRVG